MTTPNERVRFADYANLVHWLTIRLRTRAGRSGIQLEYEDVYQEVCVIWTRCRDLFDPEAGVKFSTYFINAALKSYRRICDAILGNSEEVNYEDFSFGGEDDAQHFLDYTPDLRAENPELELAAKEEREHQLSKASPLLKRLLELSVQAPPELMDQLKAAQAQADYARSMGVSAGEAPAVALTPQVIGKMMRFNWRHRKDIQLEEVSA